MAVAQLARGKVTESIEACRAAIRKRPDYAEAHNNLGNALKDLGSFDEAAEAFNAAILASPDHAAAYSNLLLCQHYRSDLSPEAISAETRRFTARFGQEA